jgi:hypothetical protein
MEALILIIVVGYLAKKGVESGHLHWQSSKAANRRSTRGRPVSRRAASAVQHDAGYWLHQVLNGFPQTRHGVAAGWHAGRTAQAQGIADRRKARADHMALRARLAPEIREHLRRQAEALAAIRAAQQPVPEYLEPEPEPNPEDGRTYGLGWTGSPYDWPAASREEALAGAARSGTAERPYIATEYPPGGGPGRPIATYGEPARQPPRPWPAAPRPALSTPSTEGTPMPPSGDTTYTQQLREFTAIRDDAEAQVNDVRVKRMLNHLDILQTLGLDKDSLAEAAAIDDALREQQKAAQNTLDAADSAIQGLRTRHGGIKQAADDAPVDRIADPAFYED